jgi:hypothetical protein
VRRSLLLIAAALGLGLLACGGDEGDRSGEEPSVRFVRPSDGAPSGPSVTAEVALANFGGGELHFSLDGGRFDDPSHAGAAGRRAFRLGTDGLYSPTRQPTITYSGLPPGAHTIRVELAHGDHSPIGASDAVSFTVE